jgi:hypothetical protein
MYLNTLISDIRALVASINERMRCLQTERRLAVRKEREEQDRRAIEEAIRRGEVRR